MTRQLFFAITILATGVLLNSPSGANQRQCQERGIHCIVKCDDPTGGAGDLGGHQNKCSQYCSRQLDRCMTRNATIPR